MAPKDTNSGEDDDVDDVDDNVKFGDDDGIEDDNYVDNDVESD